MPFSRCQRRSETSAIPPVLTLGHWRGRGKQSTAVSKLFRVESGRRDETTPFIWVNGVASTASRSSSLQSSSAARLSAAELTASAVVAPIFTAPKLQSIPSTAKSAGTAPENGAPAIPITGSSTARKISPPQTEPGNNSILRQQRSPRRPQPPLRPNSPRSSSSSTLEFHAEHVVVLSEPWLARPECANGVQVSVDALFPHVICFDAVRPHRETRRPLKERALVDYGCASPTRKTAL